MANVSASRRKSRESGRSKWLPERQIRSNYTTISTWAPSPSPVLLERKHKVPFFLGDRLNAQATLVQERHLREGAILVGLELCDAQELGHGEQHKTRRQPRQTHSHNHNHNVGSRERACTPSEQRERTQYVPSSVMVRLSLRMNLTSTICQRGSLTFDEAS